MSHHAEHSNDIRELGKKIKGIRIAMLTTAESSGVLRSRPMVTQEMGDDGDLWFFTYGHSPKADDVETDQHVNLSYAQPDHDLYVSISGIATLVRDRQKMETLWTPYLKTWFPKGLDEPDLALLRIRITQAEYWDSDATVVQVAAGFVKAAVTGKTADVGEHVKFDLERER